MTGILLRFARKTDSAGWLQILLPWSWNSLDGLSADSREALDPVRAEARGKMQPAVPKLTSSKVN
jgi:hypothetical protein